MTPCRALRSVLLPTVVVACGPGGANLAIERPPSAWEVAAPLPLARSDVGVATWDGRIWIVGGRTADGEASAQVDLYDPRTDTWAAAPPLPEPLHSVAVVASERRLYAIGGLRGIPFEPVASVYALDPVDGRAWEVREPLPRARGAVAVAFVRDHVFAFGGRASDGPATRNVERYDPVRDRWEPMPPLPTPREGAAVAVLGDDVYVIGGAQSSLASSLGVAQIMNARTLEWRDVLNMPTPRGGASAAVLAGRVHVIGGVSIDGVLDAHEAYDPRIGSWIQMPSLPVPRRGAGVAVALGRLHVFAGGDRAGPSALASVLVLRRVTESVD